MSSYIQQKSDEVERLIVELMITCSACTKIEPLVNIVKNSSSNPNIPL